MQFMETLAKRLKYARELRGWTQTQLAKESGVKQSDISKIERGDTLKPTGLIALARTLQVAPEWLDSGDGEMAIFTLDKAPGSSNPNQVAESDGDMHTPGHEIKRFDTGGAKRQGRRWTGCTPARQATWHQVIADSQAPDRHE